MARDRSKDQKLFNCSQDHEINYVVGLYSSDKHANVRQFIKDGCSSNLIYHCTHARLYQLIMEKLGYVIPD